MLHRFTGPYHPPADDGSTGIQEEEVLPSNASISRYDIMDGDEIVFLTSSNDPKNKLYWYD